MKLLMSLLVSIFLSSCVLVEPNFSTKYQKKDNYKIINIDSIENYYLIYVRRNDSVFKILSESDPLFKKNCQQIKIGDKIHLNLKSYFGDRNKDPIHAQLLDIAGMRIGKIIIRIDEKNIIHDLFYDERLIGLCIIK